MTDPTSPADDPGWPKGTSALKLILPGLMQREIRRNPGDVLVLLRQSTLSFSLALILFGVVLPFLGLQGGQAALYGGVLAGYAIVDMVVAHLVTRPLDGSSPTALRASYRTRFFLRVALADSVAVFGFVFAFIGAGLWIYYPAGAFALIRIWTTAAPTRTRLERDQRALYEQGSDLVLIETLRRPPPDGA